MKKSTLFSYMTLALVLAMGLGGCTQAGVPASTGSSAVKPAWETISAAVASKRLRTMGGLLMLDVRTPDEFAAGHIPGAVNIEYQYIVQELAKRSTDKAAPLYVYCRSGNRSSIAAKALAEAGYTGVVDFGGIIDWPYETVAGNGAQDQPLK